MKRLLFIICGLTLIKAGAVTVIGTTDLLAIKDLNLGSNFHKLNTHESEPAIPELASLNQTVLPQIKLQLVNLRPKIERELRESPSFEIFDGRDLFAQWQSKFSTLDLLNQDITLTNQWESAVDTITSSPSSTNESQLAAIANNWHNSTESYVLVGWVLGVNSNQFVEPIMDSGKTALIYDLDIKVKYKVFAAKSMQTIAEFVASGHSGIARIISDNRSNIQFDSDAIVKDAIQSLLDNIKHGLLLKQSIGVLPGIASVESQGSNFTKLSVESKIQSK